MAKQKPSGKPKRPAKKKAAAAITAKPSSSQDEVFRQVADPRRRIFLRAFAENGEVKESARIADVSRTAHYEWVKEDAVYKDAFRLAQRMYREKLEAEADRRAVQGVPKLRFYKGELIMLPCDVGDPLGRCVGTVDGQEVWAKPYVEHEYSDNLLMFRLKRLDPNYKDRVDVKAKTHSVVKVVPEQGRGALFAALHKRLASPSVPTERQIG